jgi:cobalamin synthase
MEQQTALIISAIILMISGVYSKIRFTLNSLSAKMSPSKTEQNKFEVIMQPKWFLYSTFLMIIFWFALTVILFMAFKWLALLYLPISIVVVAILSFIVPPSKKSITVMFFKMTHARYRQRFNYAPEEEELLIKANDYLSKLTNLKN